MKPAQETNRAGGESKGYQFGTFKGVFTPSILTILGVVMYLRIGWVLGNVGLPKTLLIVTMSTAITFITGLSLSALATNRKVEGGGAYFIISRALGIEAGAAVGIPLFFAQALGIAFYIAGFSESVCAVYDSYDPVQVGVVTLIAITVVAYISADLALKSQLIIMVAIFVSLISFFLGSAPEISLDPSEVPAAEPFWIVFAVFFPAVTGILAGVTMSGDLKNPAKSLPIGTMSAILVGYLVYMVIPIVLSFRLASVDILRHESMNMILKDTARWGMPILLGLWAASLSSAVGSILSAPRTMQALARDKVIPRFLGRGFGKGNDPRIATAFAFVVGLVGILLGDLNVIAPVLSMFFLTSYGLLNVSAGLEELARAPSWRPKFRIPWYVSLIGAFGCFATMFMINAGATFIALFVALGVYFLMERRSIRARWGDMRSGILMLVARNSIYALTKRKTHEGTWKPNLLVLSGAPTKRWYLIELAGAISQDRGFVTVAAVLPPDTPAEKVKSFEDTVSEYLDKKQLPAVVKIYPADNHVEGAKVLTQAYGYGPIKPNTVMMGASEEADHFMEYTQLMRHVNKLSHNLVVVRESDEQPAVSEGKRIDVWWYGPQQNLGLLLALAYLLKSSSAWRGAELVLKTIVNKPEEREELQERQDKFIESVRIQARAEVIVRSMDDIFTNIRSLSDGADLVMMGMRPAEQEESDEEYCSYYESILKNTEGMPPTVLVLAAEEMDHYAIFDAD
ncbi:hypothetical protein BVX97_03960 [bacterium E08(2017)]|nr:hypothetical protein BVX97_03960 [bacterium E08(2017)]